MGEKGEDQLKEGLDQLNVPYASTNSVYFFYKLAEDDLRDMNFHKTPDARLEMPIGTY